MPYVLSHSQTVPVNLYGGRIGSLNTPWGRSGKIVGSGKNAAASGESRIISRFQMTLDSLSPGC